MDCKLHSYPKIYKQSSYSTVNYKGRRGHCAVYNNRLCTKNGYRLYLNIYTWENLLSIYVADLDLIDWSVRSYSRRGGIGVKGLYWRYSYLSQLWVSFIRLHEN